MRYLIGSAAVFAIIMFAGAGARCAEPPSPSEPTDLLLAPRPGQINFDLENLSGFIGSGSLVRVREFQREGTGLHFPALGINTVQLPSLDLTYWFDQLNAAYFRFRYFDVGGDHFFSGPVMFNGSMIAGGQTLHSNPTTWFALTLFYERRLRPLYRDYEWQWPRWLRQWDLRGKIGLEYTYLDFEIDSGHAPVTPTSKGEETKEDFYHQELPIPTLGLEAWRQINENLTFETSVQGNWINNWNSLRNEGGTVWLSQSGVETHFRVMYSNPQRLGPFHPMVGFALYYYTQLERSTEDGNFIRWFTYGPEYGVQCTF